MRKIIYIILPIFLLMGTLAAVSTANAEKELRAPPTHERSFKGRQGPGGELSIPHGRWWNRPKIKEQLKLSEKQTDQLEKISLSSRKDMIRLKADMEILSLELEPLMEAKKFDRSAVEAVLNKIEVVRTKMSKVRTKMLLDTREVLTQDQYKKLKEIRKIRQGRKPRASLFHGSARK